MRAAGSVFLLTSGANTILGQTYGYESTIAEMWRVSDLVECLIFFALALMLAYTVFVTARFFRRYYLACREFSGDFALASERSKKNLVGELSRGVETLKAIAFAAPFLGLAGITYGILCLFSRGYIGLRGVASIPLQISVAFVATAAGLIVAIPAAISYNILRTCLEKFESSCSSTLLDATPRPYGFAQTLPLRRRFSGTPAFALIGVPVLGIVLLFMLILGPRISMGLSVHVTKIGMSDDSSPILISVIGASSSGESTVYVNSKKTPWNELGNTIRSQLKVRPHWIVYVEGEDNVLWAYVANAIDVAKGLNAEVVLLTTTPKIGTGHQSGKKIKRVPQTK
jgi:biopolymer transport protein ExbD